MKNMQMCATKPELVKYTIPRAGKSNDSVSKFEKEFKLVFIVIYLSFTALGIVFLICIF